MILSLSSSLKKRLLTILLFGPPVCASIWVGQPYVDIFLFAILAFMLLEWSQMSLQSSFSPMIYAVLASFIGRLYLEIPLYKGLFGIGGGVLLTAVWALWQSKKCRDIGFHLLGCFYIGASVFFIMYMVHEGLHLFFLWLMVIIWASDSGAYLVGRLLGGPKFSPSISPNKTWSGFLGGIATATLAGVLTAPYLQKLYPDLGQAAFVSGYLSFVGHLGDLLESFMKRYYNVKDSGGILPGHGGMLDRFDSLLLVSFAAGLLIFSGF